jgi:hypothetical protein
MEFPVEVEEVKSVFSMAKSTAEVIRHLLSQFKEPDDDEAGENGDREDCIKEAILILSKETQAKKSSHVEKFVENTLLNPECKIEPPTIFSFLKDIEQMTWRQFCLLEGFKRKDSNRIKIGDSDNSGINGISIGTEIKKLIGLNYLSRGSDSIRSYTSTSFEHIRISQPGQEISNLLDLQSVEISEIGKAFGKGRIQETVTY